mmetsp:Transcript_20746/g.45041  ORF Transcript_20746/g.45041 Transcript_20746/m.45041 type:complete len:210 (+) Transcript_20746:844-1473(+)
MHTPATHPYYPPPHHHHHHQHYHHPPLPSCGNLVVSSPKSNQHARTTIHSHQSATIHPQPWSSNAVRSQQSDFDSPSAFPRSPQPFPRHPRRWESSHRTVARGTPLLRCYFSHLGDSHLVILHFEGVLWVVGRNARRIFWIGVGCRLGRLDRRGRRLRWHVLPWRVVWNARRRWRFFYVLFWTICCGLPCVVLLFGEFVDDDVGGGIWY